MKTSAQRWISVVALSLVSVCALAVPPLTAQEEEEAVTLRGRIVDVDTGGGLLGATVALSGITRRFVTDLDGRVTIDAPRGLPDPGCQGWVRNPGRRLQGHAAG